MMLRNVLARFLGVVSEHIGCFLLCSWSMGICLMTGCSLDARQDEPQGNEPSLGISVASAKDSIEVELYNNSSANIVIVKRLDPQYQVVSLLVTDDADHKTYPCNMAYDWVVGPEDLLTLPPGQSFKCQITLAHFALPRGNYHASATYTVSRKSFFVEPWFQKTSFGKERFLNGGESMRPDVSAIWFGAARSPVVGLRITGNEMTPRGSTER
jgi:hypothetical protein